MKDKKLLAFNVASRIALEMQELALALRAAGLTPPAAAEILLKGTLMAVSGIVSGAHGRKLYAVNRPDEEVAIESMSRLLGLTDKPRDPEEHAFAEGISEDFSKLIIDRVLALPPA